MRVTLVEHMGSDASVIAAARRSFRPRVGEVRTAEQDARLIEYLATGLRTKERAALKARIIGCETAEDADRLIDEVQAIPKHFAPFCHPQASFDIEAPIFVARQLAKHQIGLVWSELSLRYVDEAPDVYCPEHWRGRPADVKQGSGGEPHMSQDVAFSDYRRALSQSANAYNCLTMGGVAPEMARMVLPVGSYTAWRWTGSLYAFARVCIQRLDPHAQDETRRIAEQISAHMARLFPVSWRALVRCAP